MHARLRSDTSLTRLTRLRVFSFEKENSARNNIFESQRISWFFLSRLERTRARILRFDVSFRRTKLHIFQIPKQHGILFGSLVILKLKGLPRYLRRRALKFSPGEIYSPLYVGKNVPA